MHDAADAYIAHLMPGRLRVRIPDKKGDIEYFASLRGAYSLLPSIERLEANPLTASVLFTHTGDADTIIDHARAAQLFNVRESNAQEEVAVQDKGVLRARSIKNLNERMNASSIGDLNPLRLASLGLVSFGLYQFARGKRALPAWYTAFWYAFNINLLSRR